MGSHTEVQGGKGRGRGPGPSLPPALTAPSPEWRLLGSNVRTLSEVSRAQRPRPGAWARTQRVCETPGPSQARTGAPDRPGASPAMAPLPLSPPAPLHRPAPESPDRARRGLRELAHRAQFNCHRSLLPPVPLRWATHPDRSPSTFPSRGFVVCVWEGFCGGRIFAGMGARVGVLPLRPAPALVNRLQACTLPPAGSLAVTTNTPGCPNAQGPCRKARRHAPFFDGVQLIHVAGCELRTGPSAPQECSAIRKSSERNRDRCTGDARALPRLDSLHSALSFVGSGDWGRAGRAGGGV